jgi:hypothetical protein
MSERTTWAIEPSDRAAGVRWIYVAGAGRSGSTMLGALLAQVAGAFNCGELVQLWVRLAEGRLCQCGVDVTKCQVWAAVAAEVRRELGLRSFAAAAARIDDLRRPRSDLRRPRPTAADVELRVATEKAVERVTGASLFVDTSKSPFVLATAVSRRRQLLAVHLVRDPRGVAYSNLRPKADPARGGALQKHRPVWKSSLLWDQRNYLTERVISGAVRPEARFSSVLLTYERLVSDPDHALDPILAVIGSATAAPGSAQRHAVAGNPVLFERVSVVADQRWRHGMTRRDMTLVAALTAPLLLRYGYALGTGRSSPASAPATPGRRAADGDQ